MCNMLHTVICEKLYFHYCKLSKMLVTMVLFQTQNPYNRELQTHD